MRYIAKGITYLVMGIVWVFAAIGAMIAAHLVTGDPVIIQRGAALILFFSVIILGGSWLVGFLLRETKEGEANQ